MGWGQCDLWGWLKKSPVRGLGNGAELFCQEFIPMVTPFCYKYCTIIKTLQWCLAFSGLWVWYLIGGGTSDIGRPLSVHQCVGVSLWDCFKQKRL